MRLTRISGRAWGSTSRCRDAWLDAGGAGGRGVTGASDVCGGGAPGSGPRPWPWGVPPDRRPGVAAHAGRGLLPGRRGQGGAGALGGADGAAADAEGRLTLGVVPMPMDQAVRPVIALTMSNGGRMP